MTNRIGSLCTGYGGLDMAVERVLGGEMVWYSEFDKHPSTLLAQRFPGIPNLGDLTKIDWSAVEPVDILTGGYPCQPFSVAGLKQGESDHRHLWPYIREAVRVLRPRITFLENVGNHRRIGFQAVLRDCAEDGLDVRWATFRASDVGAPHRRERLFFVVTDPASSGLVPRYRKDGGRLPGFREPTTGEPASGSDATATAVPALVEADGRAAALLPTPNAQDGQRGPQHPSRRFNADGLRHAQKLPDFVLLEQDVFWDKYASAIRRWESLTRPAPPPTEPNKNGRPRLRADFDEWVMGLPEGWVTDSDLPYGAKLKMLGNGVVPQQAELALRWLIGESDLTLNEAI